MPSIQTVNRIIKPILFVGCLIPLAALQWKAFGIQGASLGANPVEALLHELGLWALRFLAITLAITPLRDVIKRPWPLALRRMLGLFAFFYLTLHFIVWLALDLQFDWSHIGADIAKRPFITIGFTAFVLMIPLAVTSTNKMMRRLGKRWTQLHRLVYVCAILGLWHFYWLVKADVREPLLYAALFAILFSWRLWANWKKQRSGSPNTQSS
jgi:methionine sulfoxide reductase heme-binding subunit